MVSELIRRPQGAVGQRVSEVGADRICTSIIVSSELRYGALRAGSPRLQARVESLLAEIPVLPLEAPADGYYAEIREYLARRGLLIGPNDLLIAAHARSLGQVVVTANEQEFRRVPGLRVENWLV